MTPLSLPELETGAFRRSLAAALGLPIEGEEPRRPAQRAVVAASSHAPAPDASGRAAADATQAA